MQATTHVYLRDSIHDKKRKQSRSSKAHIEYIKIPEEVIEIIKEEDSKTNYSGGVIAILVILFVLGLIALATYLTTPKTNDDDIQNPLTLSRMLTAVSLGADFELQTVKDDNIIIFRNSSQKYYKTKLTLSHFGKTSVMLDSDLIKKYIRISPDMKYWLIKDIYIKTNLSNEEWIYRLMHVSREKTYTRTVRVEGFNSGISSSNSDTMMDADWGPTDQLMVVIMKGNLYYSNNPIEANSFICLSCRLNQFRIYGTFIDYYKEIFKSSKAYWWSDEGKFLLFNSIEYQRDKLQTVPNYKYNQFNLYPKFTETVYSSAYSIKSLYNCQLYIANLMSSQTPKEIFISKYVKYKSFYLIHVKWLSSSLFLVVVMARNQQEVSLLVCGAFSTTCSLIHSRKFRNGFINIEDYQTLLFDEIRQRIILATYPSDLMNLQIQIGLIEIQVPDYIIKNSDQPLKQTEIKWITYQSGEFAIVRLKSYQSETDNVYYLARNLLQEQNKQSGYQHLFRMNLKTKIHMCVTCRTKCLINDAQFWSNSKRYIHICAGPMPQVYTLHEDIEKSSSSIAARSVVLESNIALKNYLVNTSLPKVEFSNIPMTYSATKQTYTLTAKIHLPQHLNRDHLIKYPVVLYLPEFQMNRKLSQEFSLSYIDYLVSFLHYAVVEIDTRSSDNNHNLFYWLNSNTQFNQIDAYDLFYGIKHLLKNTHYLDQNSVVVIGSKYGGHLAMKLMHNFGNANIFRCSVAVDPIVDFGTYDSFFTEKYLGQYSINPLLYENSRLKLTANSNVQQITELLIVSHMNNENNIHFDSLAKYMKELVNSDIMFNILPLYETRPSETSRVQKRYLLMQVTDFLVNCVNRTSLLSLSNPFNATIR